MQKKNTSAAFDGSMHVCQAREITHHNISSKLCKSIRSVIKSSDHGTYGKAFGAKKLNKFKSDGADSASSPCDENWFSSS